MSGDEQEREALAARVLDAVVGSLDRAVLAKALEKLALERPPLERRPGSPASPSHGGPTKTAPTRTAQAVLSKIVLSDILDDSILGARPGDTSYPLRMFFGTLGDELDDDTSFALANGLNFYFRASMDEESKLRVATEVSRLFYRLAEERPLDPDLMGELSPLLARLMSTELTNLALESVDRAKVFDSSLHERDDKSDGTSAAIRAPKSFLARVVSNGRIRAKASVRT